MPDPTPTYAPHTVRLVVADTGAVCEWQGDGVEHDEYNVTPWRETSLRLALNLVPELEDAIDRARVAGETVTVEVRRGRA